MLADEHNEVLRLPRWSFIALSLLWSSCCLLPGQAQAQISIKENKQAIWSFPGAKLVDGQIVAAIDAKPKFERVELTVTVESAVDYKFSQMKARKLPEYERVTLEEVGKGVYRFRAGAPEGQYLLEYTGIDPGIGSDEIRITLERAGVPEPEPLPEPTNDIERIVNNAMLEMRRNYGNAFKRTSEAVTAGQLQTDGDLVKFMNPLTKAAREQAVAGIDGLLQDKLPRDGSKIKPEAAGFFRDIAAAFERGTK